MKAFFNGKIMENNVFTSNTSDASPVGMDRSKELCDFEPLIDFTGTPNRGICETIHELPNEESSDVSLEMNNEDFYSFSKNSMDVKVNATTNGLLLSDVIIEEKSEFYYSSNGYESSQRDCCVQTDETEKIKNRELIDKEIQTDNMMALRRKLLMRRCSVDSTATPPSELRKQITDLRDELQETHVFHDLEIKVLQEEYLSDDSKSDIDEDTDVDDLKKSLADAKAVYLDAVREISNLKTVNLELSEKMKEESLRFLSSKQELESQIGLLQMDVRRKNYEIENLKKDKADFDFRLELQTEKFEKRVRELELALSDARNDSPGLEIGKNPDMNRLEEEILDLQRHNEDLISTNKSLQSELEACSKKIKDYEEMATSLEDQKNILKIKEDICAYNENQINVILQKNEDLTANIAKCQEEIKKIKISYEISIKTLKEEWNNEVKVLKCEKDSLNDIIRQLSEENNVINEALKNSKIDNDSLNDVIRQLGNENKSLDEALKNIKTDDLEKMVEEQKRMVAEIDELKSFCMMKDMEIELLREKQAEDFKQLNEEIHAKSFLETEVERLKVENGVLNETIERNIKELKMVGELLKGCEEKSEKDLKNFKNEYDSRIETLLQEKDELNEIFNQKNEELLMFKAKYEEELERIELDWKARLQNELINAEKIQPIEETIIKSESLPVKVENPAYEMDNSILEKEEMDNTFNSCRSEIEEAVKIENLKEEVTLIENPENLSYVNELRPGSLLSFEDFVKEFSELLISRQVVTQEEIDASGNVFYLLADKYLALLGEHELLRNENREIESKAFECLENLCSQLEASDSTLNASNNSLNFTGDVRCSTMMFEPSEIETTVVNDITLAVNDPLAITRDVTFQTPLKTPMKTPFKTPLRGIQNTNSKKLKSVGKSNKDVIEKMNLISEYEEIIAEKGKMTEELEKRIVKLEDLATVFEDEKERIREKYLKDVEKLKNLLKEKSEELNDLRNKLIIETISLNSDFENDLNSTPTVKILTVFMETIMERCKIVEQELTEKFNSKKTEWDEQKKHLSSLIEGLGNEKRILSDEIELQESKIAKMSEELKELKESNNNLNAKRSEVEGILSNQNEEIRLLYSRISEFDALKNNLVAADEIISCLRNEVQGAEALKSEIMDLRAKLQDGETNLKSEVSEKEKILKDLEKTNDFYEKVQVENENLKKRICQSEDMISELEAGLAVAKEGQNNNEIRVQELINEIELLKKALSEEDVKNKALEVEIEEQKAIFNGKLHEAENLLEKNEMKLVEVQKNSEEVIGKLNSRIQDLSAGNQQIENLNNALLVVENKNKELEEIINGKNAAIEELNMKLTESEDQFKNRMEEWKNENVKMESLNKELQGEITALNSKLSEAEDRLQLQINGASDEVKSLNSALESAELKNKELQAALVSLEEKLMELEEARRLKNLELEELENKFEVNMEEARAELEKATEKVSALNAELEGAENKNKELEKLVQDLDGKAGNFKEIEEDLIGKLSGVESKNKELNELLVMSEESKKEQVEALNLKLKDAENETEVRKAELKKIQKELVISEETVEKLSVRIEELSSDNKAKNAIIAEKEIKIKQVIEMENKLLSEQNVLREENDKLLERLKDIEGLKNNLSEALSDIQNCLELPNDTFSKFLTDNRKIFNERINEYKKSQMNEMESLKNENKIQIEKFRGDIGNLMSLMSESDRKADKLQNSCQTITGEINDLRSLAISLQNELKKTERKKEVDHTFYTRRMGRLEELNKLLAEIIYEIVNFVKLPEPEKLNLFSVRNLMSSKKQIMDHISSLIIHDAHEDFCEKLTKIKCARCGPKTDGESILKMLFDVQKRVGLSESVLSTAENISGRIDKLIESEKEKLNEIIESLAKDKKILQEDNKGLLKEKLKIEIKLSDSERANKEQLEEINKLKIEISSLQTDFLTNVPTKSKSGRKSDLCSRRMDKLEELNQSLSELLTEIISLVKVPNAERLNLFSVRNVGAAKRQIVETITNLVQDFEKIEELKAQNAELDEECESYAKDIKNLQKKVLVMEREAIGVRETLETEICRLKDEKHSLEIERDRLNKRILELEAECEKFKNSQVSEGYPESYKCAILSKELKEIKRSVYNKEQRILELEDMEVQTTSLKSQIKYLESALDATKRKAAEEEEKNKKLQTQLKEVSTNDKHSRKSSEDQELLEELRMRGAMSGGVVQEIVEKEKIRKLTKDNAILKDLCRARYAEIKRLESENNMLKNSGPKNSNSMDSPIRTRCYNTRSRKLPDDPKSPWRFFKDKENQNL